MKTLSAIAALAALALFLSGCVGIVRPPTIRLRRRRHATAMAGFAFVIMGFAVDLDPPPNVTGSIGFQTLFVWTFFVIVAWGVLRFTKAMQIERAGRSTKESPIEHSPLQAVKPTQSFWNVAPVPAQPKTQSSPDLPSPRQAPTSPSIRTTWAPGESGTTASFTYVDQYGIVTDRVVANWRSEGPYIRAFCLDKKDSRTFRKDRIENWVA